MAKLFIHLFVSVSYHHVTKHRCASRLKTATGYSFSEFGTLDWAQQSDCSSCGVFWDWNFNGEHSSVTYLEPNLGCLGFFTGRCPLLLTQQLASQTEDAEAACLFKSVP